MSKSAERVLDILKLLKGHSLNGLSNSEIAKALGEHPVNVSRAVAVLESKGLATRLETGRWAHSVSMLQIAVAHMSEMDHAEQRLGELRQRVLAGAGR